jgi:hypothetical protein
MTVRVKLIPTGGVMRADGRFVDESLRFWANVRAISETFGYTVRKGKPGAGEVSIPHAEEMCRALEVRGLDSSHIRNKSGDLTELGAKLEEYFSHRAGVLNDQVRSKLMDVERAKSEFNRLKKELEPSCPLPMNKQKKEKKAPAYFTGIINMIVEANSEGLDCDYDPQQLTIFTKNGVPASTFARRVDGAFPSAVNPVAIWEIKEYYYTTTFGSRVADGVYETILDGMEVDLLRRNEEIGVYHCLMVDAYDTWWTLGRSYLCRIIDMLHMGHIDEALFGYEVIERLPMLVNAWVESARSREE